MLLIWPIYTCHPSLVYRGVCVCTAKCTASPSAFKGALRGTKWDAGRPVRRPARRDVYIRKIFHSSTISVELAQARPNYVGFKDCFDEISSIKTTQKSCTGELLT